VCALERQRAARQLAHEARRGRAREAVAKHDGAAAGARRHRAPDGARRRETPSGRVSKLFEIVDQVVGPECLAHHDRRAEQPEGARAGSLALPPQLEAPRFHGVAPALEHGC
jgi:hypothetical protein